MVDRKNFPGIDDELEIVWLMDTSKMDYVRQSMDMYCSRKNTKPKHATGVLVGYAILKPETKTDENHNYHRRFFWLKDHDRYYQPEGVYKAGAPLEAVDPRTVAPGEAGELTERAWGMPFKQEEVI
jgi:hypothetical protein